MSCKSLLIKFTHAIYLERTKLMALNKILVTGGAGFVGSHLCERLAKCKKNQVTSLDNYFTGSLKNHVDNVS